MKAEIEDLRKIKGVGDKTIEQIYLYFQEKNEHQEESVDLSSLLTYEENGIWLIQGEALAIMAALIREGVKVDMILVDPPYGTTACKWDSIIPLEPMWKQSKRVIKPNGAIVMTASQPFTSALVVSNIEMFKHEWIWIKNRGSNFANTVREPMKEHESVLVFSRGKWVYNKQMQERTGGARGWGGVVQKDKGGKTDAYNNFTGTDIVLKNKRVPSSWQKFNTASGSEKTKHPTQKPVVLMEYLIKTYTNEGETVLDFTMGSGTTGVACKNLNRNFIGIELDEDYFDIAVNRIKDHVKEIQDELLQN